MTTNGKLQFATEESLKSRLDGGDLVETAFMIQGLLAVAEYYKNGNEAELKLVDDIQQLWETVEWDWYTQGKDVLYWHWSPNNDWAMNMKIRGWNEALIIYVLAASSPTHTIDKDFHFSTFRTKVHGGATSFEL